MSLFLCQPIPLNLFHVSESSDHFPVVTLLYLFGHSVTPSLGFSLFTWLLGYHAFRFPSILLAGTLIHLCWFLFIFLSYPGVPQDKPSNLFFPPYQLYTDTSQIYVCLVFLVFLDLSLQLQACVPSPRELLFYPNSYYYSRPIS